MGTSPRTARHGTRLVVHVTGEVDVNTAADLREELAALPHSGTEVVVDLSRVTFLDSTGLGVLVEAMKRMHRGGGRLDLVVQDERVLKVFRLTALTRVFTIHRTLETALAG